MIPAQGSGFRPHHATNAHHHWAFTIKKKSNSPIRAPRPTFVNRCIADRFAVLRSFLMAPAHGRDGGYFDRAMRCCSFFAWRRIERFSCRPFSSMCFAVLSARLSADLIVSALIRACITFFPNAFPIAFSLVENHSRLVEWAVVLPFVGMAPFGRVFPACQRVRAGLFCSRHPCLPHRRTDPSGWISRGLSMFLLPIPSGGRAVLTRATDSLL